MNKIAPDDQQFPGQGMSFTSWVQSEIPGLSEKDADRVLWECTPFPIATGWRELFPQVREVRDQLRDGLTLDEVIEEVYRKMDEEISRYMAEEEAQEARTITSDWDIPLHVKSRPIVDIETDLL